MKITFQNQSNRMDPQTINHVDHSDGSTAHRASDARKTRGAETVNVSFSAAESNLNMPGLMGNERDGREKAKTLTELQQEAAVSDVGVNQDYMTVMSNTMSAEDYQKLSRDGFDFSSMDPEEAVTIVDKIKAELARSGQHIVGYTDDLDVAVLTAAVGSETLARSLAESFAAADIPATEENLSAVEKAWNMARELQAPTEGTYRYMIDNDLQPELWNFYLAQNSGAGYDTRNSTPSGQDLSYLADDNIRRQIDQVLEQAGYEANAENRESAEWFLEKDLPLTAESVTLFKDLQSAVIPVTEKAFAQAAADAIAAGRDPIHASLSQNAEMGKTIYHKAAEVLAYYETAGEEILGDLLDESGDLTARKQLEEIRLRMTAEVNVKLLKSGFAIDTAPMEQLIDALREAEKAVADQYFAKDPDAVTKYENWNETNRVVKDIPGLPAQLLGTLRIGAAGGENDIVLARFHEEGLALKSAYEKAGESYETLMTAPRSDLGDSLKKAFSNVDDLVRQLGLQPVEENRRAVRILGYNRMEITPENVERVKEADAQVSDLIRKMTPAATLQMIRDGVNPLEQSFDQLNSYFDGLPEDYQNEAESYSRYLYGLEKNDQITQQERESYIGVYRLLHQIEKKDGAAIGAVINQQAQLQFSNLLSAVRSGNFRHMDVLANDEMGMLKEMVQKGEGASISEQISAAYEKEQLAELRSTAKADSAAVQLLERGELPASAGNLLAARKLHTNQENPYKTLKRKASELWERLSDKEDFREEYAESIARMQTQTEEETILAAESSLDVRALRLTHRQLSIMGNLAGREEYFLSMEVGEEEALVHLTLENGREARGGIDISVDLGESTHLEAHLQVKDGKVEGFLLGKTAEEVTKLREASDIFYNLINEDASGNLEAEQLPVVTSENAKGTRMSEDGSREEAVSPDNGTLYHVAKLFLQAIR